MCSLQFGEIIFNSFFSMLELGLHSYVKYHDLQLTLCNPVCRPQTNTLHSLQSKTKTNDHFPARTRLVGPSHHGMEGQTK